MNEDPENESIFSTLFHLIRINKVKQEQAASSVMIYHLVHFLGHSSKNLKQFAFQILCEMPNAGPKSKRALWDADVLQVFIDHLFDSWQANALDSIMTL